MADTGSTKTIKIKILGETKQATDEIKKLNRQIDGLNKQVNRSNKSMKTTTSGVKKMGASFKTLSQHLARLVVIYGSFQALTSTVKTFANFEQSIKTLGAVSGSTEEQLASLEAEAKRLGETTVFSASQVAEGMTELARAGLSAEEQIAGIKGVLDLAIVGNLGLAEATKVATGAMNGFGLEANQLGTVADVLAQGANDSAQSVSELGQSMSKVAPVAKAMGNSLMETTALLQTLADNQIKGALGGTQLKMAMLRLSANKEVKKYLQELSIASGGISTAMYDATGKVKPFAEQLDVLATATANMTQEARILHLTRIVGTEAITGVLALLDGVQRTDEHLAKLRESFGYASKASDEMMNTLTGSYKELMSALEGLQIKIGEQLSPALRTLIDDSTEFIRSLSDEDIKKFSDALVGLIDVVDVVSGGLQDLIGGIGDLLSVIPNSSGEFDTFKASLEKVDGVITLLIIGMIAFKKQLLLINPIFTALAVSIGLVTEAWLDFNEMMENTVDVAKKAETAVNKLDEVMVKVFNDKSSDLTVQELKKMDGSLKGLSKTYDSLIDQKKQLIIKNKSSLFWQMDDNAVERVKKLESEIEMLNQGKKNLIKTQEKVVELGNKATNAIDKESTATESLVDAIKLQVEELEKAEKAYAKRLVNLEKTLGNMSKKERKYTDEMKKLDAELADTRKDHATDRLTFENDFNSKIKDLQAGSLSDLRQYHDAQLRADQQLALAKDAIKSGEFDQAQVYYDEYLRLIQVNATEEIKEGKKVVRTKKAGLQELIRDEKAGHDVGLELLNQKQKAEENAILAKKLALEAEMLILKAQMKLQIMQIELIATMMGKLENREFDNMFANFKKEADKMEAEIDALTSKQRQLKIDADVDKAEIDKLDSDVQNDPIKANIDADTSQAEEKFTTFKRHTMNEEGKIIATVDVDTKQGKDGVLELKKYVNTEGKLTAEVDANVEPAITEAGRAKQIIEQVPIVPPLDLNSDPAISENSRFVALASKPIIKVIQIKWLVPPQPFNTGGMVQNLLPRFADGGHLDDGVGHSRKSGNLGGYGGGDKIKALLEAGEFIVKKEAVKALGLARLHTINQGKLPRFNQGGAVNVPRFATGGSVQANKTVDINLNLGNRSFAVQSDESVANALAKYLQGAEF